MKISEFNYILPEELVATHPVEPRDTARMLVMSRDSGQLVDRYFYDLAEVLQSGDVLVFNDSRVIPARLVATTNQQLSNSSRKYEVLLIKNVVGSTWECWLKPGKKARVGDAFTFSEKLTATYLRREEDIFILEFNLSGPAFYAELTKIGEMPVPPYILKARELETRNSKFELSSSADDSDYQTVYARSEGSVAAPTAGLHFTSELMEKLTSKGIQLEYVTLHVGLGTFQPVTTEDVEDFQIHSEYFEISPDTAERLNIAKSEGRRIIAVGTTSVRVLESATQTLESDSKLENQNSKLISQSGNTAIYIYPGYKYRFVDGMVTNFHLPGSSLLLLVSAFAGKESVLAAYDHAVQNKYRFYSYGDGMVII